MSGDANCPPNLSTRTRLFSTVMRQSKMAVQITKNNVKMLT